MFLGLSIVFIEGGDVILEQRICFIIIIISLYRINHTN